MSILTKMKKNFNLKRIKSTLHMKATAVAKANEKIIPTKHNGFVEISAERMGVSYEEAKAKMDEIRDKYDITYKEFTTNKLFNYKTPSRLQKRIDWILDMNKKYVERICNDTGWSFEKAEAKAKAAKKKFGLGYRYYYGYQFYSYTDDEIREQMRHWDETAAKNREIVKAQTGWTIQEVRKQMNRCNALFKLPPSYYILYKAWELTDEQLENYARQEISSKLWVKYNDREQAGTLSDKFKFDQLYKDYIGRKFWVNTDTDYEEFKEFTDGIDQIFCKPIMSGGGVGTHKYDITHDEESLKALYDSFMAKDRILVEECVQQNQEIEEFLPGCVNTIRVVVLEKDGVCNVICTGIRFGYNGITDNFSQDGMVCDVDKDTGIILTPAIDKKGHIFEEHPISGKKFVGFQIPLWDQVIKTACDAIKVQEGVNYVGWDLAVCKDKVVIIEGNSIPDLVLLQAPYSPQKIGKKYLFEPYL